MKWNDGLLHGNIIKDVLEQHLLGELIENSSIFSIFMTLNGIINTIYEKGIKNMS